jgi:uncharacterized protein (DUF305 family)
MRVLRSVGVLAVVVLALAGCGGGSDAKEPAAAPVSAGGAAFNDGDVAFAQGMIPHHENAIEMADIALDPAIGASAAVQDLARDIKAAQDPEVEQMTALLAAWGEPVTMDMSAEEMDNMDGMMSAADMDALGALTGPAFDAAWAKAMIEHHQGAINMSQTAKTDASAPEVLALADAIIATQTAEIATLTPLAG